MTTTALVFVLLFNAVVISFPVEPRGDVSLILAGADAFYPKNDRALDQYLRDNLFNRVLDPLFAQNWNVDMYICSQHRKEQNAAELYHQLFMNGSSAAQPRRLYLEMSDYGSPVSNRKKFNQSLVPQNFRSTPIGMVALYRVQRCYMAALESNISYSFFIRTRPDLVYFSNVPDLRALDQTKLYSRSRFASGLVSVLSELSILVFPMFHSALRSRKPLPPSAVCKSFCPGESRKEPAVMCPIMDEMLAIVGAHSLWLDPYFFAHQNSYANSGRISKMYHGKFSGAFGIPEVRTTAAVLTANPKANQTPHLFYEPLRWNVTIFRGDLHLVRIARKIFSRSQEVYDCTTRNYTLKN
jgi:hypothetical protein